MPNQHLEETQSFKNYKQALETHGIRLGQCQWEAKTDPDLDWPDVFCFVVHGGSPDISLVVFKQHGADMGWMTYLPSPHNHFHDEAKLLAQGFNT